jgi:large subunit ribosomal protein L1
MAKKEIKSEEKLKKKATASLHVEDKKLKKPSIKKADAAAKAGKRSAKSVKEQDEIEKKKLKKQLVIEDEASKSEKPKTIQKTPRSRLERRSKKYRTASELIDKAKKYSLEEAVGLAIKTSKVNFDAALELHINLGVDPKQSDQNIRDTIVLPNGTGKTIRVAVIGDPDAIKDAKKAGADIVGSDELLQEFDKGHFLFDVLISTPSYMAKLGKYAKSLGPKGLMPNPKSGTVTNDINSAVKQSKAGRVEYRVDSTGIVHLSFGKVSFGEKKLLENAEVVLTSIKNNKPSGVKGTYLESMYLTTSMGPSMQIEVL